jgi:hypothetical protein
MQHNKFYASFRFGLVELFQSAMKRTVFSGVRTKRRTQYFQWFILGADARDIAG